MRRPTSSSPPRISKAMAWRSPKRSRAACRSSRRARSPRPAPRRPTRCSTYPAGDVAALRDALQRDRRRRGAARATRGRAWARPARSRAGRDAAQTILRAVDSRWGARDERLRSALARPARTRRSSRAQSRRPCAPARPISPAATAIAVVDLGCGAGSNLRALAPHLPRVQHWRLVDHDPRSARRGARRADAPGRTTCANDGADLVCERPAGRSRSNSRASIWRATSARARGRGRSRDRRRLVRPRLGTLDAALVPMRWPRATAALRRADLRWRRGLVAAASRRRGDARGLSRASGAATRVLARRRARAPRRRLRACCAGRGYTLRTGAKRLAAGRRRSRALIAALADGVAGACRETGLVAASTIAAWRAARRRGRTIGHVDLFAAPP